MFHRESNGLLKPINHMASQLEIGDLDFGGVCVIDEFVTEIEEETIVDYFSNLPWVASQSGRLKQDYGLSKVNFKKQKVKLNHLSKMPELFKPFITRVQTCDSDPGYAQIMAGFTPIELNVLEYNENRGSHIAPHFDDFWIWGERIVGLNLMEPTVMTFSKTVKDTKVEIEVPIPRRSLYLISRQSRFEWMHGIKLQHIQGRRMVCTLREIALEYGQGHPDEIA